MGTLIGRVDRVEVDDEEKDADEVVVEALFEHWKLYPCRNNRNQCAIHFSRLQLQLQNTRNY